MKILIVGAGAVGAVYGWHLKQAGHDVVFYTKLKYLAEVSAGLTLHHITRRSTTQQHWARPAAIATLDDVRASTWDQVWLTIPSDALRRDNMHDLLQAIGTASIICLQPDIEDVDYVREQVADPRQVMQGLIPFISYQSPLPHCDEPEGISYYLPPLSKTLLSGNSARRDAVISALRAGGLGAAAVDDFPRATAASSAFLITLIAALELNDWHLTDFASSGSLALGTQAAGEALAIVQRHVGANTAAFKPLLWPRAWHVLIPLSQYLVPLPLETYLRYHFTKVGGQTRMMLGTYIRLGQSLDLPTTHLAQLREKLI